MPKKQNVIITGCAQGIGLGIVKVLAEEGYSLIGIDKSNLEKENVTLFSDFIKMDLGNASEIEALASKFKNVEIFSLINNAAMQIEKPLIKTNLDEWDKLMNVNVRAIYYLTKTLINSFSDRASIVNISSVHAKATSKGMAAYVTSKGAVSALTRCMALELAHRGIRVNAVLPGAIDTPMLQQGLQRTPNPKEARQKLIDSSPLKRMGTPQDIGQVVSFLINEKFACNITGTEINCDSGVLAMLATE
jgi:NAD(P)-dependent dehydrogenase (short-subunit alcohol dehydrogenase family)